MRIGFDLDGIFVDKPPMVPKIVIEWLYRGRDHTLAYRIPSRPEQFVRKVSHMKMFRPPIKQNIRFIKQQKLLKHTLFLISGRFGFLQKETEAILRAHVIDGMFSKVMLNIDNEQPHLFKEKILKKLKIDLYVDDDLRLLEYLQQTCPKTKLVWLNSSSCQKSPLLDTIHDLTKIVQFLH